MGGGHYTRDKEGCQEQKHDSCDMKGLDEAKGKLIATLNIRSGEGMGDGGDTPGFAERGT